MDDPTRGTTTASVRPFTAQNQPVDEVGAEAIQYGTASKLSLQPFLCKSSTSPTFSPHPLILGMVRRASEGGPGPRGDWASHDRIAPMATLPFQKTSPRQTETGWLQSTEEGILWIFNYRPVPRLTHLSPPPFFSLPSPRPSSTPHKKIPIRTRRRAGPGRGVVLIVLDRPGRSETCSWCFHARGVKNLDSWVWERGWYLGPFCHCNSFSLFGMRHEQTSDRSRRETKKNRSDLHPHS